LEETVYITAFTAQLCASHLVDLKDFLFGAELDFYTAFEKIQAGEAALKSDGIQTLNVNVLIAAQWILRAGEVIYNREEDFSLPKREGLVSGIFATRLH
jgi:hypothetical protein